MALRARHIQDFVKDPVTAADVGVGDLCLVAGKPHVKRSLWSLGTVERILPSSDSKARALEIRVGTGLITRPLEKVCPVLKGYQLQGQAGPPVDKELRQRTTKIRPVDQASVTSSQPKRPTRAAKSKGRERVQGWCKELQEEDLL